MKKNIVLASSALLLSSIFFVINDAIINYLSSNNIQFYHFIFYGTPAYLSLPIYLFFKKNLKKHLISTNYKILIIRSLIFSPMPFITFLALKNISLPEFTTLNMSSPLVGAILAFFILKEKLNIFIYISLLFGFTGVLFVVQPGFDTFNIYFLVTLLGVCLITLSTVIVNKFNNIATAIGYFIYGGLIIHITSFILFLIDPLKVDLKIFFLITTASIFINLAIFLATYSFRMAQKYYSAIFCLVYLQIICSSLVGYFFFNEYLNTFALIGAILIVFSGIISVPGQIKQVYGK